MASSERVTIDELLRPVTEVELVAAGAHPAKARLMAFLLSHMAEVARHAIESDWQKLVDAGDEDGAK